VVVTVNSIPTINAGNDQSVCAGSSVTLSASGAQSYSWNNAVQNGIAFVPNQTQTYTVTGTNAQGCSATDQVVVTVNSSPTINAGSDTSICEGESILLSAAGAPTIIWNNGSQNGTYYTPLTSVVLIATGTDVNGCQATDQVNINLLPNSTSVLNENALDSYTLNGQTYTQSGTYTQNLTNSNGCDSTITLNLQLSFTGITELNEHTFRIYPNPTSGLVIIEALLPSPLRIIDQMGRTVFSSQVINPTTTVNIESIGVGVYFIELGKYRERLVVIP
jgi:hypothetical protein